MMKDAVATDEFSEWYVGLPEPDALAVANVVDLLELRGVNLGFPYSSAIKGSRIALRELRVQSQGEPLRVFYAFDPERSAVLLIGGCKTGDDRFYERLVPRAEKIFYQYLFEQERSEP